MNNSFFLTRWFFLAMRWLYETLLTGTGLQASYAIVITIFLFTLAIRVITVFSDIKSRKSSMQMQEIQPELDKLRKKYGNDPQKLNVMQKKFMQEKGVSTLSGCLPLLIMMPLFFIFISAFRAWSNEQALNLLLLMDQDPEAGIALFNQYKFFWILNIWRPDNLTSSAAMTGSQFWTTFTNSKTLVTKYIFFSEHEAVFNELLLRMGFFVKDASGVLSVATDNTAFLASYEQIMGPCIDRYADYVNGYAILPIIAGGTSFLLSKISMMSQPKQAENPNAATGKTMMYIMPVMTVVFCWQYDATFSLYWTFSNVFAICINLILNKTLPKSIERSKQKRAAKLEKENSRA